MVANNFSALLYDSVWLSKRKYDEAANDFYKKMSRTSGGDKGIASLVDEIASARMRIQNSLKASSSFKGDCEEVSNPKTEELSLEVANLKNIVLSLQSQLDKALDRIEALERKSSSDQAASSIPSVPVRSSKVSEVVEADDDDLDLFGSDEEEDDKATKLREERLQAYAQKKSTKAAVVAKSSVVLDVKPWDDETDMKAMEDKVREIQQDGLVWGASKLVPLAYSIKKLQIVAVVEDEKVSIDWLQETITEIEDLVQSVDIAAFNKL